MFTQVHIQTNLRKLGFGTNYYTNIVVPELEILITFKGTQTLIN